MKVRFGLADALSLSEPSLSTGRRGIDLIIYRGINLIIYIFKNTK
jgi:hypothetical protein